ncbi:tetratricopeptide repeat protein [uncultured Alistipes sp.]|jgi:hypothetical protein|uniref:tetratricopeptide repeat protein n=1 Tax=uncultured Alistipes sp. TaxID=538949 RepID=UPI0025CF76EA|nr:tetratricopeptide repeat protein [uncultured Alistipes sp.]
MKRLTAITALVALFCTAFAAGKGPAVVSDYPDSLRSVWFYTEGIKQNAIFGDSTRARELFVEAIRNDSTYAPAYYEMAVSGMYNTPDEAVELARSAYRLDTTNKWYHHFLGQTLIFARRYDEALSVYRRLRTEDAQNPDNYRILAALYEQAQQPYSALATLDSAEVRFGRIPVLSSMKRQLLISTRQMDKAVEEAKALVEATPYEAQNHVILGDLYAILNKDSLALAEYDRAMQIDSTDISTLMALSDYHNTRRDYKALLSVTRRLFETDGMQLDAKIKRFEQLTSDTRFYREYYIQLNALISTLVVRYPQDKRVVELYAKHLIASGELEQALALYKLHLDDKPPVESYYRSVIDIESYLQHPDSAAHYINRAIELFPGQVDFQLSKGHTLNYTKQYDKAVKAYEQSLRYASTDSLRGVIWGLIGDTWHQKAVAGENGNDENFSQMSQKSSFRAAMKKCFKAYDRSLRYDPDNAMVLNNYAYFLSLEERDLEKALSMASRATALTDNNPTYLDTHAWVLFKLGRAAEAKKIMQQAIALDSRNSPELLIHYGDILHALGEQFMAEIYWRKALDEGYDANQIDRRIEQSKKAKEEPK